ncbi:DUF4829 domain-containing protein [Desulfovirgula thermocuniculi]|uniref:DUF4829 domain-containing protein n=1 Tax=Desulfovirgula thermocuniculi TaxID=348842 RepID=UPI0004116027|nr:DUF4829 domain-containing protein [Desulfovirgula thermocuniculi]
MGVKAVGWFAVALLLLIFLSGCSAPPREEFSYREDRRNIAGLTVWEYPHVRTLVRIDDPAVAAFFLRLLEEEAIPAAPPEPPPERHYLSFFVKRGEAAGETRRYPYLCRAWDPDARGYIELDDGWVQVPPAFNGLLFSLAGYRQISGALEEPNAAFLKQHGWTALAKINSGTVKLPERLLHRAGEFPVVLYWAYNNELSRDVGLDLSPYLGQEVEVSLYKVAEPLPEFMGPRRWAGRAVVVKSGGRIIGSWLDAGRHYGFACSLKGRRLEEVTGKTFAQWAAGFADPGDERERKLATLSLEEVIRVYYDAVNRGDHSLAYACLTRESLTGYLFANMDNNWLYNGSYEEASPDGIGNVRRATVLSVKEMNVFSGERDPETRNFAVEVDLQFKKLITMDSGRHTLFFTLKKEPPLGGWRIAGIGTGP